MNKLYGRSQRKNKFVNEPKLDCIFDSNDFEKVNPNLQNIHGYTSLMYRSNFDKNTKTVKILLDAGADPNIQTIHGYTALMLASRHSNKTNSENARILLNAGADPNIRDKRGETALMRASQFSNKTSSNKTVIMLLAAPLESSSMMCGADPNIGHGPRTALRLAIQYGSKETVRILTEAIENS